MSSDDYEDEEFDEIEEWEYFEEEERPSFRDRVAIKDIIKLLLLFVAFAGFFLYFRFWDFFVGLVSFGSEELGQSRMLYFTLIMFPFVAALFLVGLVNVSKTLFIPPRESGADD